MFAKDTRSEEEEEADLAVEYYYSSDRNEDSEIGDSISYIADVDLRFFEEKLSKNAFIHGLSIFNTLNKDH